MKILVLSDSHARLGVMRQFLNCVKPQAVVHLGDHYDDAVCLAQDYPHISFHIVPGNCDRYRCPQGLSQVLQYEIGGVKLFITHGHLHHVKSGIGALLADARRSGAQGVLYGHTHEVDVHKEEDGLWVVNPGSCGYGDGTAALLETDGYRITACRSLTQADLEVL